MGDMWMIGIVVCDRRCELPGYLTSYPLVGCVDKRHPLWINLRGVTNIKVSFTSSQNFHFLFKHISALPPSTPTQRGPIWSPHYSSDVNQLTQICQGLSKKGQMCRCPTVSSFFSHIMQSLQKFPCPALKQLHDTATGAGKKLKTVEPRIQGAM